MVLNLISESLEQIGFSVSQRSLSRDGKKAVGYQHDSHRAVLRLPAKKAVLLRDALQEQVDKKIVDVNTISSLLGVWLFGALLNRNLLAIPNNIFQLIEENRDRHIRWWPAARDELAAMARAIPFIEHSMKIKPLPYLFATDA